MSYKTVIQCHTKLDNLLLCNYNVITKEGATMNMTVRSKVIKIGNSRGIRIPHVILEQVGLTDEVEMKVDGDKLIIRSSHHPRRGWDNLFVAMAKQGDDQLLDETTPTQWDEDEWTW